MQGKEFKSKADRRDGIFRMSGANAIRAMPHAGDQPEQDILRLRGL